MANEVIDQALLDILIAKYGQENGTKAYEKIIKVAGKK